MAYEFVARKGLIVSGSAVIQDSVTAVSFTGSFTGSLFGTASYTIITEITSSISSSYAETASYVNLSQTASYVQIAQTASFVQTAQTASYVLSSSYALSSSFSLTASSADNFIIRNQLTASGLNYPSADNGEFSFIQTDGNGNLSLQYVNTLYETIYNGELTTIVKGTPVYVSGSQGANSIVYRADAGDPSKMPVIYITADNIAPADTGRGIALGLITGVDTIGYPTGTEIFVGVGGGWVSIRPTGSAIVQTLGIITKEGVGGQGVILNPGPAVLPNLPSGSVWVGNSGSFPTAVLTSSLSVAFAVSSSVSEFATSSSVANFSTTASFSTTSSFSQTASYIDGGFY